MTLFRSQKHTPNRSSSTCVVVWNITKLPISPTCQIYACGERNLSLRMLRAQAKGTTGWIGACTEGAAVRPELDNNLCSAPFMQHAAWSPVHAALCVCFPESAPVRVTPGDSVGRPGSRAVSTSRRWCAARWDVDLIFADRVVCFEKASSPGAATSMHVQALCTSLLV